MKVLRKTENEEKPEKKKTPGTGQILGCLFFLFVFLFLLSLPVLFLAKIFYGTPLHFSSSIGSIPLTKILISMGSEIDSRDNLSFQTPLHEAVLKRDCRMAEFLLLQKACPNTCSGETTNTPLYDAAEAGDLQMVELLVKYGADPKMENSEGVTPAEAAGKKGFMSVVNFLTNSK